MKITAQILKDAGACPEQYRLFRKLFGDGGTVTLARCLKHADKFDWDWTARNFLSASAFAEYDRATTSALAEYQRVRASALAEYQRATAPAFAEYERATAPAFAEYERVRATAYAEYERVRAPALAEYRCAKAAAFFHATKIKGA